MKDNGACSKIVFGCSVFFIVPIAVRLTLDVSGQIFQGVTTFSSALTSFQTDLEGLRFTDLPERLGATSYADQYVDAKGNRPYMGFGPALTKPEAFGFKLSDIPDLTGKVVLITGANSSLGRSSTFHLAEKGATVVLGCGTLAKAQATMKEIRVAHPNNELQLEPLVVDLGSFQSIRDAAKGFAARHDQLHSLILNAAIGAKPFGLTEDGVEEQFCVNHVGHFLLTKLLLPTVEAASTPTDPATIVVVTSMAHFHSYPEGVRTTLAALNDPEAYDGLLAYGQSKLANVLFAQELATRVKNGVLVNSVHPGGVIPNFGRDIAAQIENTMPAPLGSYAAYGLKATMDKMSWHPDVAALTQLYTAVGPKLKQAKTTGSYFHPIARQNKPCAIHSGNMVLQKALWKLSEQLTSV